MIQSKRSYLFFSILKAQFNPSFPAELYRLLFSGDMAEYSHVILTTPPVDWCTKEKHGLRQEISLGNEVVVRGLWSFTAYVFGYPDIINIRTPQKQFQHYTIAPSLAGTCYGIRQNSGIRFYGPEDLFLQPLDRGHVDGMKRRK
jgi:hypothetical protein